MKYEDFEKFVQERCMYETIYDDSDGRRILVIRLLDAYSMVNEKEWVGLGPDDFNDFNPYFKAEEATRWAERKLKEKNG